MIQRIWLPFLLAIIVAILPLPEWLIPARPQFILLIFLYLQLYASAYFSLTMLLLMGFLLDILYVNSLGLHAIPMLLACSAMINRQRRFKFFTAPQQGMVIFLLVLLNNFVFEWISWLTGSPISWESMVISAFTSTLCWPILCYYMRYWVAPSIDHS